MTYTRTEYYCDNCNAKLPTFSNGLDIVTRKNEGSIGWRRLHVKIEHRHGSHNAATTEPADLCQPCAISLLKDALSRVTAGERASKGTEGINAERWVL